MAKAALSPSSSAKNAVLVGAGTLVSRLLGFVRDAAIAWLLGGSASADALTAALRLPYMARRLFGEGTLSLSLTAACARERLRGGSACGLALAVTRRLALWAGLLALLCVFGAEGIMRLTAPGLVERPETLAEAAALFRICAPYLLCVMLAAGCMAALHSRCSFLLPTLTPVLFNMSVIACAFLACAYPQWPGARLIAFGVLCGGLLQWLAQLPAVTRLCREERRSVERGIAPERVRSVLRRIPAGILGAAMPQLAFLGASALASLLPEGHMASLFYAERLLEFPLGVLGAAVGMAAAPRLAELAAAERLSRASASFPARSKSYSAALLAPHLAPLRTAPVVQKAGGATMERKEERHEAPDEAPRGRRMPTPFRFVRLWKADALRPEESTPPALQRTRRTAALRAQEHARLRPVRIAGRGALPVQEEARTENPAQGHEPEPLRGMATQRQGRRAEKGAPSTPSFLSEIQRALLLSLGLNLPAAAGLAAVSLPLVALVLGHGAFDEQAVSATALALCAYAPGLPAYALSRPLLAACHALENGVPLRAAAWGLLVSLAAGGALTLLAGAWGPPLGVSLGLWCNAALLWRGVSRSVPLRLSRRSLAVQGLGTLMTFAAAWGVVHGLDGHSAVAQLACAVPAGAAVYGVCVAVGDKGLFACLKRSHTRGV
ncbi:lipid II flippase MurJ [uncultured Bilophila sp.]|nr:lipid II flippase MurJ [uncultured Bilophila sp.]